MSDKVTIEEQEEMGLRPRRAISPYVAPAPTVRRMSAEESAALQSLTPGQSQPLAQQPIQLPVWEGTHTGHVRHVDDPITNAKASIMYGHVIGGWVFGIFSVGVIYIWLQGGLKDTDFALSEIALLAVCMTVGLLWNRQQGLHHSATGIAHAEIKTKGQMFATQAEVEKYRIDADKEVRLAEVGLRREALGEFVKRLGEDKS